METRLEILAIGNELCYGRVYDTNSFWIANQSTQLGAVVQRITCVPDNIEFISSVFNEALNRNPHFIISTGGLGPTSDDLTIESLSKLLNMKIATYNIILQAMADRRGVNIKDLPPALVKMARTLDKAECLPNPLGWAPVTIIYLDKTTISTLPGPPQEMKACFTEHLAKKISNKTQLRSLAKRILVPMYESQISQITNKIMSENPGVYLKPLVSEYKKEKGLPVDIITFGEDKNTCKEKIDKTLKKLKEMVSNKTEI